MIARRYRLIAKVGQGGMGTVWKAHDELLGRAVAIKEVDLSQVSTVERPHARERTLREARTAARLSHPNAVTVFDVVEEHGQPWIVMSLVLADSLADVIAQRGPLAPERAAEIGLAVLSALEAAHQAGILHRDVKPSNVLIGDDGTVVLTDFGIATLEGDVSLTSTGMLFGAPPYIAPERARGQRPGPASDLWSLGATLYTAVEGKPPFDRGSPMATLTALVSDELPVPRSAGRLTPALKALLERDPQRRVDAAGARRMLEEAVAGRRVDPATRALPAMGPAYAATRTMPAQPTHVGPPGPPGPPPMQHEPIWGPPADPYRSPPRRSRATVVALVVLALALAGAVGAAIILANNRDKSGGSVAGPTQSGKPTLTPTTSASAQPSPTASAPPAPSADWPTLPQGSSGDRVRAAQYLLKYRGKDIAVNGRYGEPMAKVVRDFQHDHGLAASGDIDGPTWAVLTTTVRRGDDNDAVKAAQTLLEAAGLDVAVDGLFGPQTEAAVKDFQTSYAVSADGIVGTKTWIQLVSGDG